MLMNAHPMLCLRYTNDLFEICPRFDNISKTLITVWLSDSPTWIQDMLAHLKELHCHTGRIRELAEWMIIDQSGSLTTIALHLSLMRPILGRWMSSQRYATWCHKMCFFRKMRTSIDLWLPAPLSCILPNQFDMVLGVPGVPHGIPQPLPRSLFRVNKLQLDSGLGDCCERRVVPVCLLVLLPHHNVEFAVVLQRVMEHWKIHQF